MREFRVELGRVLFVADAGFEGRLQAPPQRLLPIDLTEKGVFFDVDGVLRASAQTRARLEIEIKDETLYETLNGTLNGNIDDKKQKTDLA